MEDHLIENNKIHSTQAEGTSPTVEPLITILGQGTNQTYYDMIIRPIIHQLNDNGIPSDDVHNTKHKSTRQ